MPDWQKEPLGSDQGFCHHRLNNVENYTLASAKTVILPQLASIYSQPHELMYFFLDYADIIPVDVHRGHRSVLKGGSVYHVFSKGRISCRTMNTSLTTDNRQPIIDKFLTICRQKRYAKKSLIIRPGDSPDALYYVLEGSLSISMPDENGKDYVLTNLKAGDFIGEIGLFVQTSQRSVYIQAKTDCVVAKVSHALLWNALENELKDIALEFLKIIGTNLSTRLLQRDRKVFNMSSQDVLGRITHTLEDLCSDSDALPHPQGTKLNITRSELGRMAGCSREMASKTLKVLKERGVIASEGRSIIVLAKPES